MNRTLMPMAVMAFTGLGGSARPGRIRQNIRLVNGDIPEDALDPFIDYIAEELARAVRGADTPAAPGPS
jgi:hypothetical protein